MKRRSGSNAAAATQWLWQQGSGTGSDSGCLGFASVTRAVGVAGVGAAAKETQQLTPQQLTQRSWPQFSIVRRGGSGAGREGAAQRQRRTAAQGRAGRIGASAAVAQQPAAQRRSGSGSSGSGSGTAGSGSGAAAAAHGGGSSGSCGAAVAAAQRWRQLLRGDTVTVAVAFAAVAKQ